MKKLDLEYLCGVVGSLCGIPLRLYQGEQLIYLHDPVNLPKDPMALYKDAIWKIDRHVGYFVTTHFHYYGIVNSGDIKIVIGPARQIPGDDQELRELAFRLDVPREQTGDFVQSMRSIVPMPLESIMQILCTMNYVLSGEKLTLQDIAIFDSQQNAMIRQSISAPAAGWESNILHNTYEVEQTLLRIIRKGDTAALRKWAENAPAVRGGVLAAEQLRQMKNTFIVTTTLASRAAIRGGMDIETAFSLSDSYVQKCELINAPDQITNLQFRMVMDYTERVERIRLGSNPTRLALDVANYVHNHISEAISTEEIARTLFISRPHLSKRFREETGKTLTDYILGEKTEEAKRLLRYSDKSITAIGDYLGFSSQGHFARVFRKYAGCTPSEYREKYST